MTTTPRVVAWSAMYDDVSLVRNDRGPDFSVRDRSATWALGLMSAPTRLSARSARLRASDQPISLPIRFG